MVKEGCSKLIELSSLQFYALLQCIFISAVMLYQFIWFAFAVKSSADCFVYGKLNELENSGTIVYQYIVNGNTYENYGTRNGVAITVQQIEVEYLSFAPSFSRINTFYSNWLSFIVAYLIYFTFTTLLFFIPNDTMPTNSYFYFTKKKPWVNIIEK